jgi:outer membrane protein, multidrug efflux system
MIGRCASVAALVALAACSFEPAYRRPAPAIPATLPDAGQAEATPARLSYRDVFRDPKLVHLIDQALAYNQDLKAAYANVLAARAQVAIQQADLLPQIGAAGSYSTGDSSNQTRSNSNVNNGGTNNGNGPGGGASSGGRRQTYTAQLAASWELDLFGRIRSLSNAALNEFYATEAAQRGTRLNIVAGVANAYLKLAADRSLLAIAIETRSSAAKSVDLTRALLKGGVAPRTDLRQAETILVQAEVDQAALETAVEQDRNALQLLVGAPISDALLPGSLESVDGLLTEVPAGLDSSILLRRPDVVQAEYRLRASNARIGAARAAFFPQISLTAFAGFASSALSNLLQHDAFAWNVTPRVDQAIFAPGAFGNARLIRAQRDLAIANYQKAIQTAFRDISDALARRATIDRQLDASTRLDAAARDSLMLSTARYREGVDPYLGLLDAQRTAYAAARALASTRLIKAQNLVALYQALGGDELIDTPPASKGGSDARPQDAMPR